MVKKSKLSQKLIIRLSLASTVILFSTFMKFSTVSYFVDWLLFSVIIFTAWILIWIGWNNRYRAYQILSKIIGIPMALLNIFIGTVGLIGILIEIGDIGPDSTQKLKNGHIYKVYMNGILDASNKVVKLYQPVLIVFELEKDSKKYFWPDPGYSSKLSLDQSSNDKLMLTVIEKDSVIWRDEMKY
ncbi:MAG: hypothetical protein HWE21_02225 [Cytophagia bacterium]|nr:hypothetical protein [Cytophagia bacterium]